MEYVFTIALHNSEHPLVDVPILRTGHRSDNPQGLIIALEALVGMLKLKKTPEAVAQFIRDNASVAIANNMLLGKAK